MYEFKCKVIKPSKNSNYILDHCLHVKIRRNLGINSISKEIVHFWLAFGFFAHINCKMMHSTKCGIINCIMHLLMILEE